MHYNFDVKNCSNCFHGVNIKKNREDEGIWNCSNFEDQHLEESPKECTCQLWESYIKG